MTNEQIEPSSRIYIGKSKIGGEGGRGIFAKETISEGELIECCPIISLENPKDRNRLRKTGLVNYYFLWGKKKDCAAICLGWGSIYNHSFSPNARYQKDIEKQQMNFYALRDIAPGEEIIVNYNGDPKNKRPLRVPGIPPEAGGMEQKHPRIIDALVRRFNIVKSWFLKS